MGRKRRFSGILGRQTFLVISTKNRHVIVKLGQRTRIRRSQKYIGDIARRLK